MPTRYERHAREGRKTGLVAILGVIITLVIIVVYLLVAPPEEGSGDVAQKINDATSIIATSETKAQESTDSLSEAQQDKEYIQIVLDEIEPIYIEELEEETPEIVEEVVEAEVIPEEANTEYEAEIIPLEEPVEEAVPVQIPLSVVPIDNDILTMTSYVVQDTDNLYSIASSFGLEPATIVSVNSLSNVDSISSGDILFIPNMDGKIYVMREGDSVDTLYSRFSPACTEEELIQMNLLNGRAFEVGMKIFLPKSLSEDDKGYAPFFSIPFEGEITLSFGEMFSGRILDGIIVKGYSTKVISPLDGVVVAAGKNSVDGKYIVVSHENGYETGYYGLETVDVKKGMSIKQGDVIGSISSNGIFGKFSLLFRVEQNEVALDPELFL